MLYMSTFYILYVYLGSPECWSGGLLCYAGGRKPFLCIYIMTCNINTTLLYEIYEYIIYIICIPGQSRMLECRLASLRWRKIRPVSFAICSTERLCRPWRASCPGRLRTYTQKKRNVQLVARRVAKGEAITLLCMCAPKRCHASSIAACIRGLGGYPTNKTRLGVYFVKCECTLMQ